MACRKVFSAKNIAYFAVLLALTVVLQLFANAIPVFGITLNFSLIPIVLAGIFFGMWGGCFMGLVSGAIIFITTAVMGREPSTAFLFQANPAVLTVVCIGKTAVAGLLAGLLYRLVAKRSALAGAFVASATAAVVNTGLYLLGMVVMKNDVASYLGLESSASAVFVAVFLMIWLNFVLELAVNLVLAPAVHRVVLAVERSVFHRKARSASEARPADNEPQPTVPEEGEDDDPLH